MKCIAKIKQLTLSTIKTQMSSDGVNIGYMQVIVVVSYV